MSAEDGRRKQWHLEKSVSVTQIASIMMIIIGGIYQFSQLDKKVDLNGQEIEHNAGAIISIRQGQADLRSDIKEDLQGINGKLDRVIERLLDGNGSNGHAR